MRSNLVVPFSAGPGRRYEVRAERSTSFAPFGVAYDWSAWVIDLSTGEIAGGEPPAKARAGTTVP
jgi:hypothetical protein